MPTLHVRLCSLIDAEVAFREEWPFLTRHTAPINWSEILLLTGNLLTKSPHIRCEADATQSFQLLLSTQAENSQRVQQLQLNDAVGDRLGVNKRCILYTRSCSFRRRGCNQQKSINGRKWFQNFNEQTGLRRRSSNHWKALRTSSK